MKKLKKTVLMIAGPGVFLVEAVAIFVHLFTSTNAKPWIVGGLWVFFLVFIPLYSIEYFRQEFKKEDKKTMQFKKREKRTEWGGGNVHGTTPKGVQRPGKLFKK